MGPSSTAVTGRASDVFVDPYRDCACQFTSLFARAVAGCRAAPTQRRKCRWGVAPVDRRAKRMEGRLSCHLDLGPVNTTRPSRNVVRVASQGLLEAPTCAHDQHLPEQRER